MKKALFVFLLFTCAIAFAQDRAVLLDSVFSSLHEKNSFNGNVLVAEKGNILFEKSYGLANEETKQKLNTKSIFELASVSKQFTAMAIVLLDKQGKLKLDDPISTYIPELDFYGEITIRHLLTHTGGLPDYMDLFDAEWDKTKFATNRDIITEFARHKPEVHFKPGQQFEYSNTGYALLGYIIEQASNQTFGQFLSKHIFQPLGMKNTFVYRSRYEPQRVENYASGYVEDSLGNKVLTDSFGKAYYTYYLDGIVGDGMVNSTLEDLLIWDRALYANTLINDEDRKQIFSEGQTPDGKAVHYGFGWFVKDSTAYGKIANHSGGWAGYMTFIERHLDHDKTFIILQNNLTSKSKLPIEVARKIVYGEKLETQKRQTVSLTDEQLNLYTGIYSTPDIPMKLKIYMQDHALYGLGMEEGQQPFKLESHENHTFLFEEAGIFLVFDTALHTMKFRQGDSPDLVFTRE